MLFLHVVEGRKTRTRGRGKRGPARKKESDMKTSTITTLAAALTISMVAIYATDDNGAPQRAAANHFALARAGGPRNTALPNVVVGPSLAGGKHYAQMLELARQASNAPDVDLAHAPRPITAGKDADLELKWRANATGFQVAPIK